MLAIERSNMNTNYSERAGLQVADAGGVTTTVLTMLAGGAAPTTAEIV